MDTSENLTIENPDKTSRFDAENRPQQRTPGEPLERTGRRRGVGYRMLISELLAKYVGKDVRKSGSGGRLSPREKGTPRFLTERLVKTRRSEGFLQLSRNRQRIVSNPE